MTTTEDREYVCESCLNLNPKNEGRITVHGIQIDRHLLVWCPWCGDEMTRAPLNQKET